ncbi:hypothetical protein ACFC1R_31595 [Kitasatospora sp. NPDC056138]|uniref:hypothetical protein n=1 Tax=Kitasatospora sp. NPDC056138 TaxID=3345724 RepID=UPI0035DBBF95
MTRSSESLPVRGTTRHDEQGPLLVLDHRLDGHDTFLSGELDLGDGRAPVRIISLDDVTVLRPMHRVAVPAPVWSGTLHLPHGLRPRTIPTDLAEAAQRHGRDLDALDQAETRYALTFLGEATTESIRTARIEAIVSALPVTGMETA